MLITSVIVRIVAYKGRVNVVANATGPTLGLKLTYVPLVICPVFVTSVPPFLLSTTNRIRNLDSQVAHSYYL